jgi:hypothetical protein
MLMGPSAWGVRRGPVGGGVSAAVTAEIKSIWRHDQCADHVAVDANFGTNIAYKNVGHIAPDA